MALTVTPMLHVPDVEATIRWYESVGFKLLDAGRDDGETVWAKMEFGSGRVMFSSGGHSGTRERRDADLYVQTEAVDGVSQNLQGRVDVVEGLHDTFYGMREFIIRDLNGFWVTFGEPCRDRRSGASDGA